MIIQRKVGVRVVLLIVLALLVLLLPGMGQTKAYAAGKSITGLGTGSIQDPVNGNTAGLSSWTGNYVYYGKYNGKPVKYRVLDKASADFGVSGGSLLLDCDSILFMTLFDSGGSKVWDNNSSTSIKSKLNGNDFLTKDGVFTDGEKAAIAASTKGTKNGKDGSGFSVLVYAPLNRDIIFLLDAGEATCNAYGYKDWENNHNYDQTDYTRIKNGVFKNWWLRSPYKYDFYQDVAGCVFEPGYVYFLNVLRDEAGASPAFNVNLSSIIFSSAISSEPGSYTLTLKDANLHVKVADGKSITKSGSAVTVPYTIGGSSKTNNTKAYVLITDKAYSANGTKILQHTELAGGTGTFTLDSNITGTWGKDFHVYLLAENINGAYETDYASTPIEIFVPIESVPETPTEESDPLIINDAGEEDEPGSTFYPLCARQKKVKKNSITFTWNKVKGAGSYVVYGYLCGTHKSQKLTTTTATSYTWKKLKKGTYYKIYVVAKDGAKVISISKKVHVATSGKSYGNVTSVSVKKKSVKLKKGKTFKLGASFKKKGKVKQHRRLSYETTNPAVATVSGPGKIKAVGKGTCYVYAYTQNGLFKRVKVTVKK